MIFSCNTTTNFYVSKLMNFVLTGKHRPISQTVCLKVPSCKLEPKSGVKMGLLAGKRNDGVSEEKNFHFGLAFFRRGS